MTRLFLLNPLRRIARAFTVLLMAYIARKLWQDRNQNVAERRNAETPDNRV